MKERFSTTVEPSPFSPFDIRLNSASSENVVSQNEEGNNSANQSGPLVSLSMGRSKIAKKRKAPTKTKTMESQIEQIIKEDHTLQIIRVGTEQETTTVSPQTPSTVNVTQKSTKPLVTPRVPSRSGSTTSQGQLVTSVLPPVTPRISTPVVPKLSIQTTQIKEQQLNSGELASAENVIFLLETLKIFKNDEIMVEFALQALHKLLESAAVDAEKTKWKTVLEANGIAIVTSLIPVYSSKPLILQYCFAVLKTVVKFRDAVSILYRQNLTENMLLVVEQCCQDKQFATTYSLGLYLLLQISKQFIGPLASASDKFIIRLLQLCSKGLVQFAEIESIQRIILGLLRFLASKYHSTSVKFSILQTEYDFITKLFAMVKNYANSASIVSKICRILSALCNSLSVPQQKYVFDTCLWLGSQLVDKEKPVIAICKLLLALNENFLLPNTVQDAEKSIKMVLTMLRYHPKQIIVAETFLTILGSKPEYVSLMHQIDANYMSLICNMLSQHIEDENIIIAGSCILWNVSQTEMSKINDTCEDIVIQCFKYHSRLPIVVMNGIGVIWNLCKHYKTSSFNQETYQTVIEMLLKSLPLLGKVTAAHLMTLQTIYILCSRNESLSAIVAEQDGIDKILKSSLYPFSKDKYVVESAMICLSILCKQNIANAQTIAYELQHIFTILGSFASEEKVILYASIILSQCTPFIKQLVNDMQYIINFVQWLAISNGAKKEVLEACCKTLYGCTDRFGDIVCQTSSEQFVQTVLNNWKNLYTDIPLSLSTSKLIQYFCSQSQKLRLTVLASPFALEVYSILLNHFMVTNSEIVVIGVQIVAQIGEEPSMVEVIFQNKPLLQVLIKLARFNSKKTEIVIILAKLFYRIASMLSQHYLNLIELGLMETTVQIIKENQDLSVHEYCAAVIYYLIKQDQRQKFAVLRMQNGSLTASVAKLVQNTTSPLHVNIKSLAELLEFQSLRGKFEKKGKIRHNWLEREFVLVINRIAYMKDLECKGTVALANAKVEDYPHHSRKYCIQIFESANPKNAITFDCQTEANKLLWLEAIQYCIQSNQK